MIKVSLKKVTHRINGKKGICNPRYNKINVELSMQKLICRTILNLTYVPIIRNTIICNIIFCLEIY